MSITLQTIKKDYESLMEIISGVSTIEQLKSLNDKDMFDYINVDNKPFYHLDDCYKDNAIYVMEDIDNIEEFIMYGEYGCLGTICVYINDGKIKDIYFDVWDDENFYMLAEQVSIDEVDEVSFEIWMNKLKDFLDWCNDTDTEN